MCSLIVFFFFLSYISFNCCGPALFSSYLRLRHLGGNRTVVKGGDDGEREGQRKRDCFCLLV